MAARSTKRPSERKSAHAKGTSTLEWVVAGIGALLLGASLAYMAWFALAHPQAAPAASVEAVSVLAADGSHLVRFRVLNHANGTAIGLQVIGELREGGRSIEEREAVIEHLPPFSTREGGLFFRADPSQYELVLTVGGYSAP